MDPYEEAQGPGERSPPRAAPSTGNVEAWVLASEPLSCLHVALGQLLLHLPWGRGTVAVCSETRPPSRLQPGQVNSVRQGPLSQQGATPRCGPVAGGRPRYSGTIPWLFG